MEAEIFREEAHELLDDIEAALLELKEAPADNELINRLFRAFHTIKGSGAMFGFQQVADFTHQVETAIDMVRRNELAVSEDFLDVLFQARDLIGKMVDAAGEEGDRYQADAEKIVNVLTGFLKDREPPGLSEEYAAGATSPQFQEFLSELYEILGEMAEALQTLDSQPADQDAFQKIIRTLEVVSGAGELMGSEPLGSFAQGLRDALAPIADTQLAFSPPLVQALKEAREHLFLTLKDYEAHGKPLHTEEEKIGPLIENVRNAVHTLTRKDSGEAQPVAIDLDRAPLDLIPEETLQQFAGEGMELLQAAEESLLKWADQPGMSEGLRAAMRSIHTLKGNAGLLGLAPLESSCHVLEEILERARNLPDGSAALSDTLLHGIDQLREVIDLITKRAQGWEERAMDLSRELNQITTPPRLGEILAEEHHVDPAAIQEALAAQKKPLGELLVEKGAATPEQVNSALEQQRKKAATARPARRQDIRVDLGKLDQLINLIGELVIAENMLINSPDLEGLELEHFGKAAQQMNKIVRDLQEMAMLIRMQPVAGLFQRMNRLVHDLSRKSGKHIEFKTSGETTEVDKTVIETITDPLVHLIRNAIDHGVEPLAERRKAGKPDKGVIRLHAAHEEGNVVISVSDDGRGLERQKILAKAREKGLVGPEADQWSDQEVYQLIFQPGFSTAQQVTDISGRGVGMDVVKKNLDKIKGSIEIKSRPGEGSAFILRIPLTLAIIDGMLVRTGRNRYIIPLLSIRETFRCTAKEITRTADGTEFVRVREHLLPVVRLHELHRVAPEHHALEDGILVIVEAKEPLCIFVDAIEGQQQTVIKSLSAYLHRLGSILGVSGCTILGNGDVCLILDVSALERELIARNDRLFEPPPPATASLSDKE